MSGPLMDKQQKMCEDVENIRFSLDTHLNFMSYTCSPIFCCLSARGLEVSLHLWQSWPTVRRWQRWVHYGTLLLYYIAYGVQY